MSHVDDGELTACADGAYPVDDPVALRISAHLSTCGNCRTRLEQNEDLRARAVEILSYAAPLSREMPPFEQVQAQVATSAPRVRRTIPLAWAATIILALGLGWFGRGLQQPANEQFAAQDAAAPAPVPAPEVATEMQASTSRIEEPRDMAAAAPVRSAREVPTLGKQAEAPSEADMAASGRIAGNVAEVGRTGAGAAAPTAIAAPSAPPPSAPRPAAVEEPLALRAEAFEAVTPAEAERRRLNLPRIPELPVARVVVAQDGWTVEQTLPDGKTVSLVITAPQPETGARKATRQAAADAVSNSVTVQVGGRFVNVRGGLPGDSLRALAANVR